MFHFIMTSIHSFLEAFFFLLEKINDAFWLCVAKVFDVLGILPSLSRAKAFQMPQTGWNLHPIILDALPRIATLMEVDATALSHPQTIGWIESEYRALSALDTARRDDYVRLKLNSLREHQRSVKRWQFLALYFGVVLALHPVAMVAGFSTTPFVFWGSLTAMTISLLGLHVRRRNVVNAQNSYFVANCLSEEIYDFYHVMKELEKVLDE